MVFRACAAAFKNRVAGSTRLNVTPPSGCGRPRAAPGVAGDFIGFDGGDCPGSDSAPGNKSWESTNVRIKDMQAAAAIVLLVMSGNMQPALAQAGAAPSGAAQQTSPAAAAAQQATGASQNTLPSIDRKSTRL